MFFRLYSRIKINVRCHNKLEASTISCDSYLIINFLENLLEMPLLKSYSDCSQFLAAREKHGTLEDVIAAVKHS